MASEDMKMTRNETQKKPVKIWTDECGYMVSTLDRIEKEDESVTVVKDIKECDVCYFDSEVKHFEDFGYDYDKLYDKFEDVPVGCPGPFSPYLTKVDSKKRGSIMFHFAEKLFPGKFPIHPKCFNYPEKKQELIEYMKTHPEEYFIAKPDGGVCGQDIFMIHTIGDLEKCTEGVGYAMQRYINNPLLFGNGGRKIDYRVSMLQVFKDNKNMCYINNSHQGRIAPRKYVPLSETNKDDIESHLTCYQDLFDIPNNPDYKISHDLSTWHDDINFQPWRNIVKFYEEEKGIREFNDLVTKSFKDFALQSTCVMTPFFRYIFELRSREFYEKKGIIFMNFWGMDAILDDNLTPFWIEQNLGPSNGCLSESLGLMSLHNPAFVDFGRDAITPFIEIGRDQKNFGKELEYGTWTQIEGEVVGDGPYHEEAKVLDKLFDLYLFLTTGTSVLAPIDFNNIAWPRFPLEITIENLIIMTEWIPRVDVAALTGAFKIFEKQEKRDIYLLTMILLEVYDKDEILFMLDKCQC